MASLLGKLSRSPVATLQTAGAGLLTAAAGVGVGAWAALTVAGVALIVGAFLVEPSGVRR